ncbi:MAG: hypothetical protein AAF602_30570, partial [Myxococcota bacterium]
GESLELDLTFAVESIEWDGGFQVGLVPAGTEAPFYGIEVLGDAGTTGVTPMLRCRAGGSVQSSPVTPGEVRTARFQLFANDRGFGCGFAEEDGFRTSNPSPVSVMGFGVWDLVIRAIGAPDTLARSRIEAIRATGIEADPKAEPGNAARLAFANGRTSEARDRLRNGTGDPLLQLAIAAARDDGEALRALLERPGSLSVDQVLAHLLHCRLEALSADLQRLLGEDYPWWFAQAWNTALSRSSRDPALHAAVLSALDGLEDDRLDTANDRAAWVRLGARRTRAALEVGDLELATSAFDATRSWFDRLRNDRSTRHVEALRGTVSRLVLDRAALALRREESLAVALDAVRQGLWWAPDPLTLLDRAAAREDLASLQATPLVRQWRDALRSGNEPRP